MKKLSPSILIYIGLILILALLAAINVFLPQDSMLSLQKLPATKSVLSLVNAAVMIILYGGLGFIGLRLSTKLGFADIWDLNITNKIRFLVPALIGVGIGALFIVVDTILSRFHVLGPLPHPHFPGSLVVSAYAAIGEEVIFRLFFISFWVWLISFVILKKKNQNQVFWIVTAFSALAFALGHTQSVMIHFGMKTFNEIPFPLMTEIFFLNSVVSVFSAIYFRKYGFLAAVGIHFWTDVIWHGIGGMI